MTKPLYQQVIIDLQKQIREHFQPNEKLPSERMLMDQYDCSRNTIRLALDDLEQRGLIYRLHGKGTFVASILLNQFDLGSMYSFTQEMKELGRNPITFNLTLELFEAKESVLKQLTLEPHSKVYLLKRLRMADDEPMMFEETYMPAEVFPDLTMEMVSSTPLYELMKTYYQQTAVMAFEDVKAGIVTPVEAKILDTPEQSACLKLYRRSINDKNIPIEYTKSVARSDKFVYRTKQVNRRVLTGDQNK